MEFCLNYISYKFIKPINSKNTDVRREKCNVHELKLSNKPTMRCNLT
jgi:hypothetical protein